MLRNNERGGKRRKRSFGRLDVPRWAQLPYTYDYNMFTRRVDPGKPSYVLIVTIDTSGSMLEDLSGRNIPTPMKGVTPTKGDVAIRAAATMAESWRKLKLPFVIAGWGSRVNYVVTDRSKTWQLDHAFRWRHDGGGTSESVAVDAALHTAMAYAAMGFQPIWFHFADGDSMSIDQAGIDLFHKTFGLVYYVAIGRDGMPRRSRWPNVTMIERGPDLLEYMRKTVKRQVWIHTSGV
jgi:hypothetical protein